MKIIVTGDVPNILPIKVERFNRLHKRNCKSFKEFDVKFAKSEGAWLSNGIDHKEHGDYITRLELHVIRHRVVEMDSPEAILSYIKAAPPEKVDEDSSMWQGDGRIIVISDYNNPTLYGSEDYLKIEFTTAQSFY